MNHVDVTELTEKDMAHVLHPTTNLYEHRSKGPLLMERGEGIFVFDVNGNKYIEGLAGLWCVGLGFNEDELVEAAVKQLRTLPFYHGFGNKGVLPTIGLAERLKNMAPFPASKVFFTNSGSEANDTQLKIIWYYNNVMGRPEKKKIITRKGGYHGVTVATSCLTGLPAFREGFDLPLDNVIQVSGPNYYRYAEPGESEEEYADRLVEELESVIVRENPETIAAFFAEPVLAGGGVVPPPRTYFDKVEKTLKKYDILCVADEVVCGFGRTGNMFGCESVGMKPDTMTVAKQLSSGYMPIAAVLIPENIYEVLVEGSKTLGVFGHGITYGGHPVSAAVALRNLELFEERDVLSGIRRKSPLFLQALADFTSHPLVGDTRGLGILGAIELVKNKNRDLPFQPGDGVIQYCNEKCLENGLINRFSGNVAMFCPPLIITEEEISDMFGRFKRALDETYVWAKKQGVIEA